MVTAAKHSTARVNASGDAESNHTNMALSLLPMFVSAHYELVVHLASARPVELDALFWAVADPKSSKYAQHVSAEELRPLAGGTPEAAAEAEAWLRKLGGSDVIVSPLGDRVTASFDADADKDTSRWSARGLPLVSSQPPSAAPQARPIAARSAAEGGRAEAAP